MDIDIQGDSDGIETARAIRERFDLPVIYLTAYADAGTLERAKITEPFGYLVKPIHHANLPSSIEVAIYKHRRDQEAKEHMAMLSMMPGTMAEAVIVTNAKGVVRFLNAAAERLTEWSNSEAISKTFDEIVPLDAGGAGSPFLASLAGNRIVQLPERQRSKERSRGRSLSMATYQA